MESAQSGAGAAARRQWPRAARQCALLVGVSGLALAVGATFAPSALAVNECGPGAPGGTVTCTPAGNNFPNGIEYQVTDLTIVVQDGVIIDTTGAAGEPGGISSGGFGSYGDLVIKAGTSGGSGVVITADEINADGIFARSNDGSIAITSFSTISTKGADGISAWTNDGAVSITSVGNITAVGGIMARASDDVGIASTGNITTTASEGIYAWSNDGFVSIKSTGNINVTSDYGINGYSQNGAVIISSAGNIATTNWHGIRAAAGGLVWVYSTGDIATSGLFDANGILAQSTNAAVVRVTSAGDISTASKESEGISALAFGGAVTVTSTGDITTLSEDSTGIVARADAGYAAVTSSGAITTSGDRSEGIYAKADGDDAVVISTGAITTGGAEAQGIHAFSISGSAAVTSTGNITTAGSDAEAILASGNGPTTVVSIGDLATGGDTAEAILVIGDGAVEITSTGNITTGGSEAIAIRAQTGTGDITIKSDGDITTAEQKSAGISAFGDGDITITSDGDITTNDLSSTGIAAQAVFPGTGAVTVDSTGDITTKGSTGIAATASSDGAINVTSTGNISVGAGGTGADAIRASGGPSSTVTSIGDLDVHGDEGSGIQVTAFGAIIVSSTGAITTDGADSDGIYGHSTASTVSITSNGGITTQGTESSGIYAYSEIGGATIASTGDIATAGSGAFGIFGYAKSGAVGIASDGDLSTASGAIAASTLAGGISVESDGDLATTGTSANAISASAVGGGILVTSVGDLATIGTSAVGIQAIAPNGAIKIESTGAIATFGTSASAISATSDVGSVVIISDGALSTGGTSAYGIFALTNTGSIVIDSTGDIDTGGTNAAGIRALANTGSTKVTSVGDITTVAFDGDGIRALSTDGGVTVESTGNIATQGDESQGILAAGKSFASITAAGAIRTSGADAHAVQGLGTVGSVLITAETAIATGEDASGLYAQSLGAAGAAQIVIGGDVSGGWGADARGIEIAANFSSTLNIQSGASVGALSDVAIQDGLEGLSLLNQGTITGIVRLGSGADSFSNQSSNSWNLRNFADSDGDGVRDTEGVAVADFGAGTDSVENSGTLRLASVAGATAFDTAGQIAHPGGGNAEIAQEGVEQGFLTNLESFAHSGLITLQDGAAGDVLVITDQADGGTAGNNVFTSNGGRLALDVVLDDGSSQQSDVLVLDKAVTGSGATTLLVSNAGGAGGATSGDGILVVNVRTQSDADAFELGSELIAGAYRYDLYFQNAAKTDENWYLRSSFFEGALDYPSISSGALETWYTDLGNLHERLGERRRQVEDPQTAALPSATDAADSGAVRIGESGQGGWFRVVGADMDIEQDGAADFDLNSVRAEAGFDVGFDNLLSDDWLVLGAFAGYGWSSLGFESDADADFNIATAGAYATYFRGPYYLDALVKFDWLDGNYRSELVNDDGDVELPVFGLSLETGYRFDLTQRGLYLQPQAQLSYAHVGDDRFADDTGAEIRLEDADSLRGRIGARLGQELTSDSGGAKGNFYLEASASQEFLGETEANVTGLAIEQELPETRFEVGAGFDIALPKDGVSFTLDADYVFGDEVDGVAATGGVRISW